VPGRDGSTVFSGVLEDTPVGPLAIWVTRHGVRRVGYVSQDIIDGGHWVPTGDKTLVQAFEQLGEYFAGSRESFELPVDFSGATSFQRQIFERLMHIPHGRIASYGDIADELGDPGAARAVGQAVGANPLPIVPVTGWCGVMGSWGATPVAYSGRSHCSALKEWMWMGRRPGVGSTRRCSGCRCRTSRPSDSVGNQRPCTFFLTSHWCGQQNV
jgi:methylated-DNA-[protein]-cysteine S-methyltransferase